MDILSHGLWGGIAFGRKSRPSFWLAFVIGLAPDLFSFGILYVAAMLGLSPRPDFSHGTPPESTIPYYVHHLYNVTHSFVLFLVVFVIVWLLRQRPLWELGAWGLHVLVDVPTHSFAFFPTPLFWPLADWKFNGWQWMTPSILVPNYVVLILLYAWYLSYAYWRPVHADKTASYAPVGSHRRSAHGEAIRSHRSQGPEPGPGT